MGSRVLNYICWSAAILQARGIVSLGAGASSQGGKNGRARPASQPRQGRGATSADKRDRKPIKVEPGRRVGPGDTSGDVIDLSSDEDVVSAVRRCLAFDVVDFLTVLNTRNSPS